MKIDKTEFLGELLYIILRGEKSRIKTGIWTKSYKHELSESMLTCLDILKCLDNEDINDNDYNCIHKCFGQPYIIKILDIDKDYIDSSNIQLTNNININYKERLSVNNAMKMIINNINDALKKHKKGYKVIISESLRCIHNFPRFYLISPNGRYKGVLYMNYSQIKEYAKYYFNDNEVLKLFSC